MSDAGVRRARVAAQRLAGGHGRSADVAGVVSAVVGVQAQDRRAAALAVRARSSDLTAADVDTAVAETGSVVLTWSLRGTRHLHHQGDVRWIVGLLGPLFARPGRRAEQLGIAGATGERAVQQLHDALASDGPLSREEVKERLAAAGVDPSGQAPIHVISRAALEGILCVLPGPGTGRRERYVLTDDWVPAAPVVPPEEGAVDLARRYLGAYGPATVNDFAAWSGLPAPAARAAWAAVGSETTEVTTSSGPAWVRSDQVDDMRTASGRRAGVRLLGAFDGLLLGYADRDLLVPPEHRRRVNSGGGMVRPTVLVDGEVVGTWSGGGRGRDVEIDPFHSLTGAQSAAVDHEIADLRRFHASP